VPVDDKGREKDPAANLPRRTLASSANVAEACPDPEILAAYADRALDADETARYELHFSQCAHCRDQLAAMDLAAVSVAIAKARPMRWVWPWTWFVLAPVASALLIAAVFVARRPAANRAQGQQTPLVAMQTPSQPPAFAAAPEAAPIDTTAPATPERRAEKSAPPKPATTPGRERTPAFASPIEPAPDKTVPVQAERAEDTVARAPVADKVGGARAEDLPRDGGKDSAVRSRSQSVTADSSAQMPKAAPPLVADGAAGGVSAGAVPEPARLDKQQPAATLNARNGFAASQTVSVESAIDRDVNTIVRSPDPQILWRISGGRFVERSSDAGQTWRAQWTSVNAHVVAGSAPSVEACWLVGGGGIVLLTTDGKKWRTIEPPVSTDFVGVAASDASSATVISTDGRKFETSDGGKHWTPAP
jgi:putative zinc finger protein